MRELLLRVLLLLWAAAAAAAAAAASEEGVFQQLLSTEWHWNNWRNGNTTTTQFIYVRVLPALHHSTSSPHPSAAILPNNPLLSVFESHASKMTRVY